MKMDFLIFTTPRSKSAWLANFLTYENMVCLHEPCTDILSLDEMDTLLIEGKKTGCVGSDLLVFADKLVDKYPEAKRILVYRDINEVAESLKRIGLDNPKAISALSDIVKHISSIPNVILINFEQLMDTDNCRELWQFINPSVTVNEKRLDMLMNMNVQLHEIGYDMDKVSTLLKEVA